MWCSQGLLLAVVIAEVVVSVSVSTIGPVHTTKHHSKDNYGESYDVHQDEGEADDAQFSGIQDVVVLFLVHSLTKKQLRRERQLKQVVRSNTGWYVYQAVLRGTFEQQCTVEHRS